MNASSNSSIGNIGLRTPSEIKESEEMSRYLDQRVKDIEKAFTGLTTEFTGYARRIAKLRNNGDKIVEIINEYTCRQLFNSSTRDSLQACCYTMSLIEDLRNVEHTRVKDHVLVPMIAYNGNLKKIKVEIKKDLDARKKEWASYKKLEKSRTGSGAAEAKARSTTEMAALNASTHSERLIKTMSEFEKEKLNLLQSIMKSFVHTEMLWHMRALERCSEAYSSLLDIDCEGDLNEFLQDLSHFRSQDHVIRSGSNLNLSRRRSQSMGNLKMTGASNQSNPTSRNELRTSVTFEDQHQRSHSFQSPVRSSPFVTRSGTGASGSQNDISRAKPPLANVQRPINRQEVYNDSDVDSEDYTEDGTTSPSGRSTNRSGNVPVPQKRGR